MSFAVVVLCFHWLSRVESSRILLQSTVNSTTHRHHQTRHTTRHRRHSAYYTPMKTGGRGIGCCVWCHLCWYCDGLSERGKHQHKQARAWGWVEGLRQRHNNNAQRTQRQGEGERNKETRCARALCVCVCVVLVWVGLVGDRSAKATFRSIPHTHSLSLMPSEDRQH